MAATRLPEGRKLLLGMVHLPPLPGSPRHAGDSLSRIVEHARADAAALLDAGFDGYIVENFGDAPFFADRVPAHVIACMTRIACELPREGAFVAANVLRNDARAALAIAAAAELQAIRVNVHTGVMATDQGIISGRAAETLRLRREIAPRVAILADIDVKHAIPIGSGAAIEDSARDAVERGLADALIVTGRATGSAAEPADLERVQRAVPGRCVLVGSGVVTESARRWYRSAGGIIVGSALKPGGRIDTPIDPQLARRFAEAARG